MIDLTDRVALITGGTRGLGRAMALALAAAGCNVIVASRKAESCREVAELITEQTGRLAHGHACHVGRWQDLDDLVLSAYEDFGRIDILINNAGMSPVYDRITSVSEDLWDKVLAVNLKGPFRLSALVGERMVEAGRGSIINLSSIVAARPTRRTIPYSAAKAGVNSMTRGFAEALGPVVRVNAIQCGPFLSDSTRGWDMEGFQERVDREYAMRRMADTDEIVGTALYLASDMSSFTTGAVICVDGGRL